MPQISVRLRTSSGEESTPVLLGYQINSVITKPNANTVGRRLPITRTLTRDQALAELRVTRYLSRVRVTGGLRFSGSDGLGCLIEDCDIEPSGLWTLQGYQNLSPFVGTKAERPIIRYCNINGGTLGAALYGSDMVIDHCDIFGAEDSAKLHGRIDLLYSWLHDCHRNTGAHNDGIQIRVGWDMLIKGTRIDAYVGTGTGLGDWASGGLQTGPAVGNIQVRWEDNWLAGGRYTMRGYSERDAAYSIDYVWRRNIFMQYGTIVALGRTNMPPNQYGPVSETLGDFDDSNVWEHTGLPVV
jgi:hypothetical protein